MSNSNKSNGGANFYPDMKKTRVVFHSHAEKKLYEAFEQQLDASWDIYYSVVLSGSDDEYGLQENEVDFLLYHPSLGVIVIEVKGGRIQYEAERQQFISIDRHNRRHFIKNPFQQARVWKSRFIKEIRKINLNGPVTHLVCFPDVSSADFPRLSQIDPLTILDQNHMENVLTHLKTIVKKAHPEKFLKFKDMRKELHNFVQGKNYTSRINLKDYIRTHESRMLDVESIHDTFVTPIASTPKLAIEGEAGTGKTLLAKVLAETFLNENKKVLFLSSNELLNNLLEKDLGKNCSIETYEGLGKKYGLNLLKKPAKFEGKDVDWVQFEAPEKLHHAIQSSMTRYDVIICDEAQDVQPFWWDAIEALLLPGEESRLYIFFDRNQGIFGSGDSDKKFVPEDVLPVPAPYFPLVNNYRTTREIADLARQFRPSQTAVNSHCTRLGYLPRVISYKDKSDAREKLAKLCETLIIEEGIKSKDICLLSARKLGIPESLISDLDMISNKFQVVEMRNGSEQNMTSKQIPASTIQSFKGLETDIGIICNISEYNLPLDHPIMASLIYVACTRARHMLYIFVQEQDEKYKVIKDALAQVQYQGSLVIDEQDHAREIIGTVEYYDPKRFGILKFESTHNNRSRAFIFPCDLPSELETLEAECKVSFIPKVVGDVLVATKVQLHADEGDEDASKEAS